MLLLDQKRETLNGFPTDHSVSNRILCEPKYVDHMCSRTNDPNILESKKANIPFVLKKTSMCHTYVVVEYDKLSAISNSQWYKSRNPRPGAVLGGRGSVTPPN